MRIINGCVPISQSHNFSGSTTLAQVLSNVCMLFQLCWRMYIPRYDSFKGWRVGGGGQESLMPCLPPGSEPGFSKTMYMAA